MPVPSDGFPGSDRDVPGLSADTADYAGLSFSAAGGTSWPAKILHRVNLLSNVIGLTGDTALTVLGRLNTLEAAGPGADYVDFTPHIYYESSAGVYTEINYGTSPAARDGWYRDDGRAVDFQMMVRLDTNADLGPDGKTLCIALPVEADTSLGNGNAVKLNADVTIGVKYLEHFTDWKLHAGRANDLTNGNFAFFVPAGVGAVATNTWDSTTSDGNATTGFHDFHVAGRYRKA